MPTSHSYKNLRLRQLRAYCACIQHQSYSAAARFLGVSQPVVWEQVRALERTFGATLLLRQGRVLVPTEDGELFLELSSNIVAGMDSLAERFAERRSGLVRKLSVAGAASLIVEDFANVVGSYSQRHPHVHLAIQAEPNYRVVELVANNEADLGVVQFGRIETISPRVITESLYDRPWFLFAPKHHPLMGKSKLALDDLVAYPLILESPSMPWRQLVDEEFRRSGLLDRINVVVEVNNALAARRLVGAGLGITILPRPASGLTLPHVAMRSLNHLFPAEHVVLIWRNGATPKPVARQFADFARKQLLKKAHRKKPH